MANLPETQQWEDGIYQIEVSDPVLGGPDGITNRPLKQLASRTAYLKQQVEKVVQTWLNTSRQQTHTPSTQRKPARHSPASQQRPRLQTAITARSWRRRSLWPALAALAGSAPETLDTLKELADALGNDPNFATTVLNKLAEKLAKDQNGADITDTAEFLKNIGVGSAGKRNVGAAQVKFLICRSFNQRKALMVSSIFPEVSLFSGEFGN